MTILLAFGVSFCHGQLQTLTAVNTTIGSGGVVQFNNFAELGQKNSSKIEYSEITGNCFWKSEWTPAMLVLLSGKTIKLKNVKLNFYSNDVHYLDKAGSELIAQTRINKVVFFEPTDSVKISGVFVFKLGFKIKKADFFAQKLNEGKLQLLKRAEVTILKRDDGPMAANNPGFKFFTNKFYYLEKDGDLLPLRNISKKNISALIKITPEDETWLISSKNKLRNEDDLVAFLNYYNGSTR